ncbi:MAG: hydrogenase iron-sulfur subunit [Chitinivibrionales bacterium]
MATPAHPDVIVYLCKNCIPGGRYAPVQWTDAGLHIRVKEMPCSGKIDAQYMLHALEGGLLGVCVVTCPHGECTLAQGNYRAEVRVRTVQRLLEEIGLDPGRAQLINCHPDETMEHLHGLINEAIHRFSSLVEEVGAIRESPVQTGK